jgi:hypothetical protein
MSATFFLGTHMVGPSWWQLRVPLFVSVRRLRDRKTLPTPLTGWALDSGGFTELSRPPHKWLTTPEQYIAEVRWITAEMPHLRWVAPQDWMCEPFITALTGLTVREHQDRTVENFLHLRSELGATVLPVIQGYGPREYDRCVSRYQDEGVDLAAEPVVGIGSVCRRSGSKEARRLILYLSDHGLRLHGFGLKGETFLSLRHVLASSDSMSWSARGRRVEGCSGTHKTEANCIRFAAAWRERLVGGARA